MTEQDEPDNFEDLVDDFGLHVGMARLVGQLIASWPRDDESTRSLAEMLGRFMDSRKDPSELIARARQLHDQDEARRQTEASRPENQARYSPPLPA